MKQETQLRKEYKKAASTYNENMNQYDMELKNNSKDLAKTVDEYES